MGEEMEIRAAEERPYWEMISCADIEGIVLGNIETQERAAQTIINSIVTVGYYLRRQRDEKMYLEQGFKRFEDYVKDRYGKSQSWASRQIDINKCFSIGGNDPRTDERWLAYGKSQLQELLYLTDEQREQARPDMKVLEIRALRDPEPVSEPVEEAPVEAVICEAVELEPEIICGTVAAVENPAETVTVESSVEEMLPDVEEASGPARCITGQSGSGFCGGAAYCSEPYTCCAQCNNDCNGRCGWLEESKTPERDRISTRDKSEPRIDFKTLDKIIATSQVITEENENKQSNRNPIKISELVSEMSSAARNSLNNAQIAIGAKAWKAALADARNLVHYLGVIVRETEGVL